MTMKQIGTTDDGDEGPADAAAARVSTASGLPSGRFSGRSEFAQIVRDALACAAREGWHEIIVSDASFDTDVIQSAQPVLVDYWATWCGPCKMIAPILEEVAGEYAGRLTVAKVDVDANPDTAAKYGIRGIPTLMLFKNGQAAATKVGALSKSQLTAFLNGAL